MVGKEGFEPTQPMATDLQSVVTLQLHRLPTLLNWFSRYDSNVDTKNQNLMSYQLDDRRINSTSGITFWNRIIKFDPCIACSISNPDLFNFS